MDPSPNLLINKRQAACPLSAWGRLSRFRVTCVIERFVIQSIVACQKLTSVISTFSKNCLVYNVKILFNKTVRLSSNKCIFSFII